MIVVAIIGLVAMMALPSLSRARERAACARVANDFKTFSSAFVLYAVENGHYPADSHETLPKDSGMETYLDADKWYEETALGGHFNWEGPDGYPYAGISLYDDEFPERVMRMLDDLMDDGNLASGNFQRTSNGRYTYIIEWNNG
jgi:type IV pilus assembly protein PilA